MKRLILSAFLLQVFIHPTIPGTSVRDYSQPSIKIEGDRGYQTIPGTSTRDYSAPGFKIESNTPYPQPIPYPNQPLYPR
jgi:hypothetical protein